MRFDLASLLAMARLSVADPRGVARALMSMNLPMQARWLAMAVTVTLSVAMAQLTLILAGLGEVAASGGLLGGPILAGVIQLAVMLTLSGGIAKVGAAFGGRGSFADALLLVTWAEFVLLLLQVAQLVLSLALPFLGDLLLIAGVALFFWQITQFTAELHGFKSAPKVFMGLLAGFFVAGFALAMVLGMFGLAPELVTEAAAI